MIHHLSPSKIKEINDHLIKTLTKITLDDLLNLGSYLLKYERTISIADISVLLLDEYFFDLEVSLYNKLGIEEAQIRYRKKYHTDIFEDLYLNKTNLLLADFYDTFCFEDGGINWEKLIQSNSSTK